MADCRTNEAIGQDAVPARYSRQILFAPVGEEGQRRLMKARVTLIGCGALGSAQANTLVRAGVGFLRIVDRDFIELNNLQRQTLFTEQDVAEGLPKAVAAKLHLEAINSQVTIEAVVADVNHRNIEQATEGTNLLLDGTDNFETRYLINDLAVKTGRPWVYGACVGATGLMMPVLPHETPCLRCVFEEPPTPDMNPTCDTVGVLGAVVNLVAAMQAMEAMKILMGRREAVNRHLVSIDAWSGRVTNVDVRKAWERGICPCCRGRQFDFLEGRFGSTTTTLCGRNAVQVRSVGNMNVDFDALCRKLAAVSDGRPTFNEFLLKARVDRFEITVFADGRAIVQGTDNPEEARTVYAKYIGG
jgi:molybdopterin-synthase adenylyltransferase